MNKLLLVDGSNLLFQMFFGMPARILSDVYAALDYLQIRHAETTACETDDWIAAYALTY